MIIQLPYQKSEHRPLQLIQFTDSHLLEQPEKHFAGISPIASLKAVIKHLKATTDLNDIDLIINTGDVAQDSNTVTYQQYLELLNSLDTPHFLIRGNHDDGVDFPKPDAKDEPIVVLCGPWCFILLNSQADHCIYGEISQAHLTRLNELLIEYQDYHTVITLHHHTFAVGSAWLDQHILKNSAELLACITPHQNVKLVLCGHVHQTSEYQHAHIHFMSSPSTFVQFTPNSEDFSLDDRYAGYRSFALYPDGHFTSQLHYLTESVGVVDKSITEY